MTGLALVARACREPLRAAYTLRAQVDRAGLMARYARLARVAGVSRLYCVLSFDCDTADDIAVAESVHDRLRALGVRPVYAVPGELLQEGADVYRRIARRGGEFINHGQRRHTYYDTALGRYASCYFYDEQGAAAVRDDVMAGDQTLRELLGIVPRGFRTPHFGTFQRPRQLRFLHGLLRELGYRYSTSTAPLYGFRYGPLFRRFGLTEIPVSGMADRPLTIQDSWGFFAAPDRCYGPDDYREQ
ncbi:MAG: polysaccharide deacetylase, partial [Gammaproteobacteria bacterium]|nr:polysaccharide deacetylase [Gammaproteobacteria bacterium]